MKFTLFTLLAIIFATTACTNTLYTHRKDYSPVKRQGAWNDYYTSVKNGEQPQAPKEKK